MNTLAFLDGLRFIDSFFPSGGYAYSMGLEAAVLGGEVKDSAQLARYVEDLLRGGIGRREAVAVAVAHKASMAGKSQPVLTIDAELDAMKLGRESRLASRQMGRQVIRAAAEQFEGSVVLQQFHAKVEEGYTPGHLPVCVGLTLAACGWTRQETVVAYLYHTASTRAMVPAPHATGSPRGINVCYGVLVAGSGHLRDAAFDTRVAIIPILIVRGDKTHASSR